MGKKANAQIRRSQVITTWGPGALLDLPRHAAIVGGLDTWPNARYGHLSLGPSPMVDAIETMLKSIGHAEQAIILP